MTDLAWFGLGMATALVVFCVTAAVMIKLLWPKDLPAGPVEEVKEVSVRYKMPESVVHENPPSTTEPPDDRVPPSIRRLLRR